MPAEAVPPTAAARPFRPRTPVVIGLLGGVASGKSTVAARFAAHGLRHIDADALARDVAARPAVLAEVAAAFGPEAVAGGRLDRAALAARVFADPAARQRLEAILHPPIRARILADLAAARADGVSVLLDVPLLLENGLIDQCDVVAFVDVPAAERQRRAAARGWPPGELERREAAQAPLATKRARAQHVLDNGGDLGATDRQVAALLAALEAGPR
ncbi:MAG: dephospho-CoA kinase [Planctomycetes bacterium]|nr:dephospho-CoA kinase [Planctomycetota bacterium]